MRELRTNVRAGATHVLGYFEIELDVAGDMNGSLRDADCTKALCIRVGLCCDGHVAGERVAKQSREPQVAPPGTIGDARAGEQDRNPPRVAGAIEVRPDLAFHDDRQRRCRAIEKPPHRSRQVVRQISMTHRVAEDGTHSLRTSRRRRRDEQRMLRIARCERPHQRGSGLHFADRDSVDPDRPGREAQLREAKSLRQAVAIGRVAQPAQSGCCKSQGRDDVQEGRVQEPQHVAMFL